MILEIFKRSAAGRTLEKLEMRSGQRSTNIRD